MKRYLFIVLFCIILSGCQSTKPDPDNDIIPPLMNTNSFTNFVPMEMPTNTIDSTNASLLLDQETCSASGTVFRIRNQIGDSSNEFESI